MVAPLDIQRVIFLQLLHDMVRPRPPVINISQNMQMVHNQTLDQLRKSDDKHFRPAYDYNGLNNLLIVSLFVIELRFLGDKLLDNICKIRRQGFTDFGSGVFGCNTFTHLDQTV